MGIQERRAREFARREDDILRAALALSNRDDWQTVTIEQIAQKAEIGKGTVYKHFTSKDDIYARLAVNFQGLLLKRVQAIDASWSALDRLSALVRVFWEVYRTHGEYQRVVEYCQRPDFQRALSESSRLQLQQIEAGFTEAIRGMVEQGIAERTLPRRPLSLMLFGAQSALVGALRLLWLDCLPGPQDQYLDELTAFIVAGLTRTPSSARRRKPSQRIRVP
jgi:AcrR family transcriptional regulator